MSLVQIRAKEQGGLLGCIHGDDQSRRVFWAYCTSGVIKYQVPIEDFLALIFDATATFIGDDELQKCIDAAQRIRSLNKAS